MRKKINLCFPHCLFGERLESLARIGGGIAIVCSAFTVAMLITSRMANAQGVPVITVDSPLAWLQITPSTDEGFASKVNTAIGSGVSPEITEALPYSVVVTNNGGPALAGLDVRFSLKLGTRTVVRNFFYHSFPEPESALLPPGRSILITPFKTVNALAGRAARGQATGGGGSQSSPGDASAIQQLASADIIRISVDLAVASDGRTAGPDAARTARIRD